MKRLTIPLCVKCRRATVSVWRNAKGYCTICDPYSTQKLLNENRRLRGLLQSIITLASEIPQSRIRGAIIRRARSVIRARSYYNKGTKSYDNRMQKKIADNYAFEIKARDAREARKQAMVRHRNAQLEP